MSSRGGIGAGDGAGAGTGADGALAQATGTSKHTTSSNPITSVNLFIRQPPAYLYTPLYYNADGMKRLVGILCWVGKFGD